MPRARAHITGLLGAHQRQIERVAELERLIAEVSLIARIALIHSSGAAPFFLSSCSKRRLKCFESIIPT